MRRFMLGVALLATLTGTRAFAVSDGNYRSALMHCSLIASNTDVESYTEDGCNTMTVTISDGGGHEYFGIGYPHTADGAPGAVPIKLPGYAVGSNLQAVNVWTDLGDGCTRTTVPLTPPSSPVEGGCPWLSPDAPNYYSRFDAAPQPDRGLVVYFGDDDNSNAGEHDGSSKVNNGASDGGGFHVALDPASVSPWLGAFVTQNPHYVLTHPLPAGDAGIGFCADGICFSAQTQRQVAYEGGYCDVNDCSSGEPTRDTADYSGHSWDPSSCSAANDGATACGGNDLGWWHQQNGTAYVEPGVQIYEDPDPGASPIGPYPLPGIYVGTCGVIVGGGFLKMPDSPYTNDAHQLVLTDRALSDDAVGC
ncbi:MAG: hypothetical protein ABR548_07285 [Actinomycetota bacterium]|nr:hypothetical protein [Actinomycetota bacterium]